MLHICLTLIKTHTFKVVHFLKLLEISSTVQIPKTKIEQTNYLKKIKVKHIKSKIVFNQDGHLRWHYKNLLK